MWRLTLLCLVILTGCADRSLAGKYAGKRPIEGPAHIAGTLARVEVDLKREGTFELLNLSISFGGEWELKDGKVILTIKSALNKSHEAPNNPYLLVTDEGLEFNDPTGTDTRPVMLKRL